mmetsp:Transcript_36557/g.80300  ORF Transcript_36557/g.80300 Transcript_36557/m.80300 type:complete len:315 (-) Transcript_36557:336-1280(-)
MGWKDILILVSGLTAILVIMRSVDSTRQGISTASTDLGSRHDTTFIDTRPDVNTVQQSGLQSSSELIRHVRQHKNVRRMRGQESFAAKDSLPQAGQFSTFEPICQVNFGRPVCQRGGQGVECPPKPQEGANPSVTGAWELAPNYVYFMDLGLVDGLAQFFRGGSAIEFGAGKGCYTSALRARGVPTVGYDGSKEIEQQTEGLVRRADLTTELNVGQADWVLCLETAEHIPRQFEEVLLNNLVRAAKSGIVISWSNNPGGNGHVNLRDNEWVIRTLARLGFSHDVNAQRKLRESIASIHWFRDTLMAFRRATADT